MTSHEEGSLIPSIRTIIVLKKEVGIKSDMGMDLLAWISETKGKDFIASSYIKATGFDKIPVSKTVSRLVDLGVLGKPEIDPDDARVKRYPIIRKSKAINAYKEACKASK